MLDTDFKAAKGSDGCEDGAICCCCCSKEVAGVVDCEVGLEDPKEAKAS